MLSAKLLVAVVGETLTSRGSRSESEKFRRFWSSDSGAQKLPCSDSRCSRAKRLRDLQRRDRSARWRPGICPWRHCVAQTRCVWFKRCRGTIDVEKLLDAKI